MINPKSLKNLKSAKKGEIRNPKGRPKGKTMKEFAREFLLKMSDDEKVKWLKSLGQDIVWKMAEGNPPDDITVRATIKTEEPLSEEQINELLKRRTKTDSADR
jgi:ribosomal protein L31E